MAQNFMDKRYSPEDALKTLEFVLPVRNPAVIVLLS